MKSKKFTKATKATNATPIDEGVKSVQVYSLVATPEHRDEGVESSYGYHQQGYENMRGATFEAVLADLDVKAKIIDDHFGIGVTFDVDFAKKAWAAVPTQAPWVENLFLSLGRRVIAADYNRETQLVLGAIKKDRRGRFHNASEGQIGPEHLRQSQAAIKHEKMLAAMQKSGMKLIVEPGNFGVRHVIQDSPLIHVTDSVPRAIEKMVNGECGVGAKKSGMWILQTPNRINHHLHLWIDCAGDECSTLADGVFSESPFWSFVCDKLQFGTSYISTASGYCGVASGFIPQI